MSHLLFYLRSIDYGQDFRALLDIAVVSYVIYRLILLARGRRAWQILIGLGVFFLIYYLSDSFHLITLNWLIKQITPLGPVAIVILLYPELRDILERLGRLDFWGATLHTVRKETMVETIEEIVRAAVLMSSRMTGALMVLERETRLDDVIANGTTLDAAVTTELICTIFYDGTPLHDGAVIIRGDRIVAAGCTLPLTDSPNVAANGHMRHKAARGESEASDAVVVVVSEERGTIQTAIGGKLVVHNEETLRKKLLEAFGRGPRKEPRRHSKLPIPFVKGREARE